MRTKLEILEDIRVVALTISLRMHATPADDAFVFQGSTNDVDELRELLAEYNDWRYQNDREAE